MTTKHDLMDSIDNIKEKLTDNEYKTIVETIKNAFENTVNPEEYEQLKKTSEFRKKKWRKTEKLLEAEKKLTKALLEKMNAENDSDSDIDINIDTD